ncbi:MAG: VCBS repeat-containing protein [Planctomycetes bacterium]|nr:VCBS repeat-containing protein [Planctomycetota bacterium]
MRKLKVVVLSVAVYGFFTNASSVSSFESPQVRLFENMLRNLLSGKKDLNYQPMPAADLFKSHVNLFADKQINAPLSPRFQLRRAKNMFQTSFTPNSPHPDASLPMNSISLQSTGANVLGNALEIFSNLDIADDISSIILEQINNDGIPDAIIHNDKSSSFIQALGNTDPSGITILELSFIPKVEHFAMFDINNNGNKEIIAVTRDGTIQIFFNQNGIFSESANLIINCNCNGIPIQVSPLDLNEDDIPDFAMILVQNNQTGEVRFYSLPNFGLIFTLPISGKPVAFFDAPFAFAPTAFPVCLVILADGRTLFWDPAIFGINFFDISNIIVPQTDLYKIGFININNDTFLDFFTLHVAKAITGGIISFTQTVKIFVSQLGTGGLFQQVGQFNLPADFQWVVASDYNTDNFVDLVLGHVDQNTKAIIFSVYQNNNGQNFNNSTVISNSVGLAAFASFGGMLKLKDDEGIDSFKRFNNKTSIDDHPGLQMQIDSLLNFLDMDVKPYASQTVQDNINDLLLAYTFLFDVAGTGINQLYVGDPVFPNIPGSHNNKGIGGTSQVIISSGLIGVPYNNWTSTPTWQLYEIVLHELAHMIVGKNEEEVTKILVPIFKVMLDQYSNVFQNQNIPPSQESTVKNCIKSRKWNEMVGNAMKSAWQFLGLQKVCQCCGQITSQEFASKLNNKVNHFTQLGVGQVNIIDFEVKKANGQYSQNCNGADCTSICNNQLGEFRVRVNFCQFNNFNNSHNFKVKIKCPLDCGC